MVDDENVLTTCDFDFREHRDVGFIGVSELLRFSIDYV